MVRRSVTGTYARTYREEFDVGEGLGGEERAGREVLVLARGAEPRKSVTVRR